MLSWPAALCGSACLLDYLSLFSLFLYKISSVIATEWGNAMSKKSKWFDLKNRADDSWHLWFLFSLKLVIVQCRSGARMAIFSLLGGANHTNLYKNLIKIWICSANLGMIGGQAPARPPVSAPACWCVHWHDNANPALGPVWLCITTTTHVSREKNL